MKFSHKSMILLKRKKRGMKRKKRVEEEGDDDKRRRASKVDQSIPHDLELDILTRLPAKSLMRFQCVSKIWCSIIRNQKFVDSHYAMSLAKQSSRFMIALVGCPFPDKDKSRLRIFSMSYDEEEREEEEEEYSSSYSLATNLVSIIPSSSLSTKSSCTYVHGLIGCRNDGRFFTCNPSTRKVKTLPMEDSGAQICLGYDPVGSQFKALTRVSPPPTPGHHYSMVEKLMRLLGGESVWNREVVHEVITLERSAEGESVWRRNNVFITTGFYEKARKAICINGFVYYCAYAKPDFENQVIVCFDVRYEKMSFIKAPKQIDVGYEFVLIEYKGKLAAIEKEAFCVIDSFNLWILEDVENQVWSMQSFKLPFQLPPHLKSPGTNNIGEIIFAKEYSSRDVKKPYYIYFYNVETKGIRTVRVRGLEDDEDFKRGQLGVQGSILLTSQYVESIVGS